MAAAEVIRPQVIPDHGPLISTTPLGPEPKQHNVRAVLNYYKDPEDGSPPAPFYVGRPLTEQSQSRPTVSVDVDVTDITGRESKYTLDSHGFQLVKHESREKRFLDEDEIKGIYYPETEQLLKDVTGATRVFIFDHTIRREKDPNLPESAFRGPVRNVHIDQSYSASVERVRYHLPEEAEELLQKRFQIINVWRPIKTILKDPLAVADAHSVEESDLVGTALIYPHRKGETYAVRPNSAHRWYFKFAQRPDEVTLIKCYDSATAPGIARRIPHSAFVDPSQEDQYPRESIEVRTLVFYDN
ncbi:hypothetical protein C8A05DRAFT_30685 [Staphylotrichum tortipilum]|uniref:Methyltransferase n=1 Tax=Staphylotrichum tortipilum TaxID=2831512 RepID=A0AAN6MS07_9PEZI|nr:hypothetical protein C8A05DRAFT_30685 [Staphylotrichum longicolle]